MKAKLVSLLTFDECRAHTKLIPAFDHIGHICPIVEIQNLSVKDLSSLFFVLFQKNERVPQGFMSVLVLQELMERAEKKNIEIF